MWVLHKERGFYIHVLSRLQERITQAQLRGRGGGICGIRPTSHISTVLASSSLDGSSPIRIRCPSLFLSATLHQTSANYGVMRKTVIGKGRHGVKHDCVLVRSY